jgi:hypothetical protein
MYHYIAFTMSYGQFALVLVKKLLPDLQKMYITINIYLLKYYIHTFLNTIWFDLLGHTHRYQPMVGKVFIHFPLYLV